MQLSHLATHKFFVEEKYICRQENADCDAASKLLLVRLLSWLLKDLMLGIQKTRDGLIMM